LAQRQQQQSRPQTAPTVAPGIRSPGWPFNQPGRASLSPTVPTDEEWRQAAEFMADASPARWQVFEKVLSRPARSERAKRFLFARYTELRELQKFSPTAYAARLQQIKFEDELFRLESLLRGATSAGERDALGAQIRDRVTDAVKKDLGERERRLAQLQERLDKEKAALEADKARAEEMVDRRTGVIRQSSERFRAWANGGNANPAPKARHRRASDGSARWSVNCNSRSNRASTGTAARRIARR
jgi:hypothetical protein